MAKSVTSIMAVAMFSVLPVLLSGCGEKEITNGENIEVSLSTLGEAIPASTVKMPLPFEVNKNAKAEELKDTLLANFQNLGYKATVEENPYAFMAMTDRVIHKVGDSKGKITINATKSISGDVRVRNDTVRVDMIGGTITAVDVNSKIGPVENPDQQTPDVLGGDMAVLQATGQQPVGADFEAEEVNRWLGLFKFASVSGDDKNGQFKRCASRYGATLNNEECLNGIMLLVDSSPGKLRALYKDSASEYTFNGIVMPKLKDIYIEKFGQPDPK